MASKVSRLVELLNRRTERKLLHWETTSKRGRFQVSFPEQTIQVEQEQYLGTVLVIRNDEGEIVERVTSGDLRGDVASPERELDRLYEAARRQALNVDETLDELLGYLGNEESTNT